MTDMDTIGQIIGILVVLFVGLWILVEFEGLGKLIGLAMMVGAIVGFITLAKNS